MSSPWDPDKRCAISNEDRELAKIDKSDNMSWLIKTDEKMGNEDEAGTQDENLKNFKKFLEAKNEASHFDFGRIMDDLSVGSMLNPNNKTKGREQQAIVMEPGVNLEDQMNEKPRKSSGENDSVSDLSSKGSTTRTIYSRIDSNEQKLNQIGRLLENLMILIEKKQDVNQDRTGNPTSDSQDVNPSSKKGDAL